MAIAFLSAERSKDPNRQVNFVVCDIWTTWVSKQLYMCKLLKMYYVHDTI